jgi:hypothetical protein
MADMHATIEELLEAMFPVRSIPRLYNGVQLPLEESNETSVRRVGNSCERVSSR